MSAQDPKEIEAPVIAPIVRVHKDWIDLNGHMNVAYYMIVLDQGIDHICSQLGIGWEYTKRTNHSTFTMQTSVWYRQEVVLDDPLEMQIKVLGHDTKKIHFWIDLYHAEKRYLAAEMEQITLHVDLNIRKSTPFPNELLGPISKMAAAHANLPCPASSGLGVSLERKKT